MTAALTRGRITRCGILRGGVAAGGILRSQRQGSPYAFNLDLTTFKDTITGQSLAGTPNITNGWLLLDDSLYIDNPFYGFPLLYQSLHGKVESGVRV